MTKRSRPAVDAYLVPAHGVSREGQPLSYNRAPAPDLAPWIGRFYAIKIDAPADYRLTCGIFNDTPMIHVQLAGTWTTPAGTGLSDTGPIGTGLAGTGPAGTRPAGAGPAGTAMETSQSQTMFTGPSTRLLPVAVMGSFTAVGYFLRPGAMTLLSGLRMVDCLDVVMPASELGPTPLWSADDFAADGHPADWFATIEQKFRHWLAQADRRTPDELTARFENAAHANPAISVAAFAAECGVGERTVERIVRRDFGMSPKQVLRRARALDMASHLRGVADTAEGDALTLRYYDQSHLIREFTDLFGMSPRQFVASPQPLLTMGLELRQCRRLAAIERLAPGAARPWD